MLAPAWMPAFFCAGLLLLLQGCSLLPKSEPAETEAGAKPVGGEKPAGAREAFSVSVKAPDTVREYLERNLEIQRYRQIDDLGAAELSRLMVAAEGNARELLGTLGYFTPTLTLELQETPEAKAPREVTHHGRSRRAHASTPACRSTSADRSQTDPTAEAQRDAIRKDWPLRAGQPFTQLGWDNAKSAALRSLTAKRFPTGSVGTEPRRDRCRPQPGQAARRLPLRPGLPLRPAGCARQRALRRRRRAPHRTRAHRQRL